MRLLEETPIFLDLKSFTALPDRAALPLHPRPWAGAHGYTTRPLPGSTANDRGLWQHSSVSWSEQMRGIDIKNLRRTNEF